MIKHRATLAVHADWSMDPRKRWMSCARRDGRHWQLSAPEPVGDVTTWLPRLQVNACGGGVALGVDLPLGLPRAYATSHTEAADFPTFLRGLSQQSRFFDVCATLAEIDGARPFYPHAAWPA